MDNIKVDLVWQIGVVVKDAAATAENYAKIFGLDRETFQPFNTSELPPELWKDTKWNGKPVKFDLKIINIQFGGMQFEIIEPAGGDENEYSNFLKTTGGGIHHVNTVMPDMDGALEFAKENNINIVTEGNIAGLEYKYFDFKEQLGIICEGAIGIDAAFAKAATGVTD